MMQISGAIKQIYLDAILSGSKVSDEIDKSSCARHVQAITDRYALLLLLNTTLFTLLVSHSFLQCGAAE
jgi:hypothetical protein